MQTLFLFVVLFCSLTVWAQTDLIADPGFVDLADNQCSPSNSWSFRSDYLWNQTGDFVDAQCQAFLELPTDFVSGVTKGNETNINHFSIPALPTVTGGSAEFPSSAVVVDMNSPCRAALWTPVTVANDSATLELTFDLWIKDILGSQFFIDNSLVPDATLLQYLSEPNGLLQSDTTTFPPTEDVVNMFRVDLITAGTESFYDRAFSLVPDHIVATFPVFPSDDAIPDDGTAGEWMTMMVSNVTVPKHGNYALRFASAHSVIGTSWGVSNVHLYASGGTVPANTNVTVLPWDMIIDNAAQTVGGTLTVSKMNLVMRKKELF